MRRLDPMAFLSDIVVRKARDSGIERAEQWLRGSVRGQGVPEITEFVACLDEPQREALRLLVRECVDAAMFSLLSAMQAAAAGEPPVKLLVGDADVLGSIPEGIHGAYQDWIRTLSLFERSASVVAAERRALELLAGDAAFGDEGDE